jgi:hypothetical protein
MYTNKHQRYPPQKKSYLLGTIGSFAPFHSQKQNEAITNIPPKIDTTTSGEFHGNVTPPCQGTFGR